MFKGTLKFIVSRRLPLLYESIADYGQVMSKYYRGLLSGKYILQTRVYLDGKVYWLENEFRDLSQKLVDDYKKDDTLLWRIAKLCYEEGDDLVNYALEVSKKDIKNASSSQLIKWFKGFLERSLTIIKYLNLPLVLEDYFTSNLEKIVNSHYHNSYINKYFKTLSLPVKQNDVVLERRDLLSLVKYIKSDVKLSKLFNLSWPKFKLILANYSKLQQKLNQHLLNYAWLSCPYYVGNPTSLRDLYNSIRKLLKSNIIKELAELKNRPHIIQQLSNRIMFAGKFFSQDKDFVKLVQEYVYLRTYRTDIIHKSGFYIRPVLEEIGRRVGLTYDELTSLTFNEVINIFKNRPPKVVIKKRQAGYIYYCRGQKFMLIVGSKIKLVRKQLFKMLPKEQLNVSKLLGQAAYEGKVVGVSRVVLKMTELSKVLKGNILVTSMTTPQFMPAMKKAAAFVTDEGGILCHAAIVSREMKKPCIIGTKIATKVFKDGDLVEVDANNGIVKLLTKK